MGGQQSQLKGSGDGEGAKCAMPCFFVDISKIKKKSSIDLIGSPEPETPIYERRKRAEVAKVVKNERKTNAQLSSRYGGLEKEVSEALVEENNEDEEDGQAKIHEGPVRGKTAWMQIFWTGSPLATNNYSLMIFLLLLISLCNGKGL
jgi:hypothetical protein